MSQHRLVWTAEPKAQAPSEATELFGSIAVLATVLLMIFVIAALAMRAAGDGPGDQPLLIEPAAWSSFTA